ncbi:hypothetical protein F1737_01255 [Methanoplanus sp. FWC-SCC4]|uniref:Pyruvate kinase C-terminal domain-containing protein n=1 Tax=Methanochimaera problematica TaxID=2609417 RepID=A0AA97FBA9_9EURY|nr:pyruvate kinase alpha/beta domain-containing protein [Methanoplanus sp. FWC-SCC4]WOF15407.1 hypothetical protein F1737_01255 [Methanoplanus sp. FWC-SCC4]
MSFTAKNTYYFEKPGPLNTEDAARFSVERAQELGISKIVVASSKGQTARVFYEAVKDTEIDLVVVTHVVGFREPGVWEFPSEIAEELESKGVSIIKGTHTLSGMERAMSGNPKLGGSSRTEAVAEALRKTVAVGLKVAVECTLIAADQGAIPVNDEIIAVGGTATGADTVCVIKPSHTSKYFDLQVREIVAMPRNR